MLFKIGALRNFAIFTGKNRKKETPTEMFFCEYCEISKNSFFYRFEPQCEHTPYKTFISIGKYIQVYVSVFAHCVGGRVHFGRRVLVLVSSSR